MEKLKAKKSLGQHFLKSQSALQKMIRAANIRNNETVVEIGPGMGVLTRELIAAGANVIAIEKDDRAIDFLKKLFENPLADGRLKLIHGDALEIDRESLGLSEGSYALVANIPYYITGAILRNFLEYQPRPNRMVLLVQKEVAERICVGIKRNGGNDEKSKESILSISVKAFGTPKMVATVPRGAFVPPPNVDSAILSIENISDDKFKTNNVAIKKFFDIVNTGFAHKRKLTIRNLEGELSLEKLRDIWQSAALSEKIRSEDVPLEKWFMISRLSTENPLK